MSRRLVCIALVLAVIALSPAQIDAQGPDPAEAVFAELVGHGYDVLGVGYYPDSQGQLSTSIVYAKLATITTDFSDRYIINQVINGFDALNTFFPNAESYVVVLEYDKWWYVFATTPADLDDLLQKRVNTSTYWAAVRAQARIYDTVAEKYITEKDFLSQDHTHKDQTNKDFSGLAASPLPPVNPDPSAQAENILVEPTTTFLPADGLTEAQILATLTDQKFQGLPGRGVNFGVEVRGQDEQSLGTALTDRFGVARAAVKSSRALDLVLVRASTANLNASIQMLVGAPPGTSRSAQIKAATDGLSSQGYRDVEADYVEYTGPTGRASKQAIAAVRVTSNGFDRNVYSQLSRIIGTLRVVMPDANVLIPVLKYQASDGNDYSLVFTARPDIWDAYIKGEIGENQLWQNLDYVGAYDENGFEINEKDFINKNFSGVDQPRYSEAERTVRAVLTAEEWGDQLTVGSFQVPVGGFAERFSILEWSGNATGMALYATPDYNTAVITVNKGDDPGALQALRLGQGQYIVEVIGTASPAGVTLNYLELLAR